MKDQVPKEPGNFRKPILARFNGPLRPMELTRFARCSVFKEHGILPPESYDTTICASNQAVSFATRSDFLRRCEGRNAACFSVGTAMRPSAIAAVAFSAATFIIYHRCRVQCNIFFVPFFDDFVRRSTALYPPFSHPAAAVLKAETSKRPSLRLHPWDDGET